MRTVADMFHVLTTPPDRLESLLNRLASLDFEIVAVTASRSSFMLSGGGDATAFTVVVRGDGQMPSDLKPEESSWW